jgi:hypothetical protein
MEAYKLKSRIGVHEFDAEGPEDAVKEQYAAWLAVVQKIVGTPNSEPVKPINPDLFGSGAFRPALLPKQDQRPADPDAEPLKAIFQLEGGSISLSATSPNMDAADAGLIILLGYKLYRDMDLVGGAEILEGLKQSGYSIVRVDRVLARHIEGEERLITTAGLRRGLKYRLNNPGFAKAKGWAKQLLGTVDQTS